MLQKTIAVHLFEQIKNIMNEENENETHKNCFGLDNKLKNEKLSKNQILFLKNS